MSIILRKPNEIAKLREASLIVAKTLDYLRNNTKIGMTLLEVDRLGEEYLRSLGARPSFKGLYGFPNAVCTSLNEVVIHGIPNNSILKDGDILGIDIGSEVDGWYGDAAITMPIGNISKEDENLIACAKDTLYYAIDIIRENMRFKELSYLIEQFIISKGYQALINFSGHGIGRVAHCEPEIPNYIQNGNIKSGPKIKNGMVFCLEPMICQKDKNPIILEDGWSVISKDGLKSSHYEHTVAIIDGRASILSKL